jgi:excisionase family DNA binding protein
VDKLLARPTEAAEALGISRTRIYELLAKGVIPSVRIGGSIRIPVDRLRAWIDEQRTPSPADRHVRGEIR